MKVFISQPMHGLSAAEISEVREGIIEKLMERGYQDFEIIDSYIKEDAPEGVGRLWYLGDSIKLMDKADLIVFANGWQYAKGCLAEFKIAKLYNLIWEFEENLV